MTSSSFDHPLDDGWQRLPVWGGGWAAGVGSRGAGCLRTIRGRRARRHHQGEDGTTRHPAQDAPGIRRLHDPCVPQVLLCLYVFVAESFCSSSSVLPAPLRMD